jgi:hypothetical protein
MNTMSDIHIESPYLCIDCTRTFTNFLLKSIYMFLQAKKQKFSANNDRILTCVVQIVTDILYSDVYDNIRNAGRLHDKANSLSHHDNILQIASNLHNLEPLFTYLNKYISDHTVYTPPPPPSSMHAIRRA